MTDTDPRALVERLTGVEITAVRANRDLLGTRPVTQAQNDARAAADALTAALDEIDRLRAENEGLKNPPEEYCAKCGHPKSNHPFRHPFAQGAALKGGDT